MALYQTECLNVSPGILLNIKTVSPQAARTAKTDKPQTTSRPPQYVQPTRPHPNCSSVKVKVPSRGMGLV